MAWRMSRNMASVAARLRCMRGPNQILPISMAAFFGCISISVIQPSAAPETCGRTAQASGSCWAAKSATKAASAGSAAKGP